MTSALFERSISEPANRLQWQRQCIAYLSLKKEGAAHVGSGMLLNRVALLEFVFDLLQLPFPGVQVTEANPAFLRAMATATAPGRYLSVTDVGNVVGLQVAPIATTPPSSGARFITEAQASRQWPLSPLRELPAEARQAWFEHIGESRFHGMAHGDGVELSEAAAVAVPQPLVQPSESLQETIFGKKTTGLVDATTLLIKSFVGPGLMMAKEKEYTPLLTKILNLKQDAVRSTLGATVERLNDLADIASAAKSIVRPVKEYMKSGRRHILTKIQDSVIKVYDYALLKDALISVEFSMVHLKCQFFMQHERMMIDGKTSCLEYFLQYDFPPEARQLVADNTNSAAAVAHHCLSSVMFDRLQLPVQFDEGAWERQKVVLFEAVGAYLSFAQKLSDKFPQASDLVIVLLAFKTLVAAATMAADAAPKEVAAAKQVLDTHKLAVQLKEGLRSHSGAALTSDADCVIVKGELDDNADEEFLLLAQAVFSEGMPEMVEDALKIDRKLLNMTCDNKCNLASIVVQGLEGVISVMRSWSQKRLSDEAEDVIGIFEHLGLCIKCFDMSRWGAMASAWSAPLEAFAEQCDTLASGQRTKVDVEAVPLLSEECFMPLRDLVQNAENASATVAKFCPPLARATMDLTKQVKVWDEHRRLRELLHAQMSEVCAVLRSDPKPATVLVSDLVGDVSESASLQHIINIAELKRKIDQASFVGPGFDIAFTASGDDPEVTIEYKDFWVVCAEGRIANLLIDKVLLPCISCAGQRFRSTLAGSQSAFVSMSMSLWTSPTGSSRALLKHFLRDAHQKTTEVLSELFDSQVMSALLEGDDGANLLQECVRNSAPFRASDALSRIVMLSNPTADFFVEGLVKEAHLLPPSTVLAFAEVASFVEVCLAMCCTATAALDRICTSTEHEGDKLDHRTFGLIGSLFEDLLQRCNAFAPMFAGLQTAANTCNLAMSIGDLDKIMEHITKGCCDSFRKETQAIATGGEQMGTEG